MSLLLLYAPGVLVGHGIGVAPTLFALTVQPSIFTLSSIGIVWLVALGLIFGIPVLRQQKNGWPPSAQPLFIGGYVFKFLLFGLLAASSLERSYRAIDAPSHVNIEGGVAGNAALAALFIVLAIFSWWSLSRIGIAAHEENEATSR